MPNNPFDRLYRLYGDTDSTIPGMPAPIPAAADVPLPQPNPTAAPAAAPTIPGTAPYDNPFIQRTARPGSVMAVFGMRPTPSNQMGRARGAAIKRMHDLRRANPDMPVNQLVLELMGTPEGQAAFTDTNFGAFMTDLQQMLAGGGSGDFHNTGRYDITINEAGEIVRTGAGVDPETLTVRPDTSGDSGTQQERAFGRLRDVGIVDQEQHDRFLAGAVVLDKELDVTGRPTGRVRIIDKIGVMRGEPGSIKVIEPDSEIIAPLNTLLPPDQQIQPGDAVDSGFLSGGQIGFKVNRSFQSSSRYERFAPLFAEAGQRYGVPADLLAAQAFAESGFRTNAVSEAGARGISQFIPGTAKRFGVNVNDPRSSIMGQAAYMRELLDMFDGNVILALAGYNWGEHRPTLRNMARTGNIDLSKMPSETRDYIRFILRGTNFSSASFNLPADGHIPPENRGFFSIDRFSQPFRGPDSIFSNPVDMFDGSGGLAAATEVVGGVAGIFDEDLAAEETAKQRDALRSTRFAIDDLRKSSRLASEVAKLEGISPSLGLTTNRLQNLNRGIELFEYVFRLKRQEVAHYQEWRNTNVEASNEARENITRLNRILATLPSYESMIERREQIMEGTAPDTLGTQGIGTLADRVIEGISGAADQIREELGTDTSNQQKSEIDIGISKMEPGVTTTSDIREFIESQGGFESFSREQMEALRDLAFEAPE